MKIHIKGGRLIDPKSGVDAKKDVYVAAGKIVAIGDAPAGFAANRVIDAAGLVVSPGLVDLSARLREPGYEYMATLESEMQAAIAGGVTSLACPPDTDPPLDEPGLVEMLKFRAKNLNQAQVYPIGALTQALKGERLTEMAELVDAGCVAFSQADAPFADNLVFYHALQYAATFGFPVWLRPQDPALAKNGVAHDGPVATRFGLTAIPVCAETVALSTIMILVRETGARVHLTRLSSAEGVEIVRQAKRQGLPITCDVAIHHAHLTEMDIGYFEANSRLDPPLRSQRDRDALRAALADGTADALCSDHTPVDADVKQLPFAQAEPELRKLLEQFGPSSARASVHYPFWHLRTDDLWDLEGPASILARPAGATPTLTEARQLSGSFSPEVLEALTRNPQLVARLARSIVEAHFLVWRCDARPARAMSTTFPFFMT